MTRNILKLGLVATLILIFFSCDDNFDITLDLQRDPLLNTTYTDTLSVRTSVVLVDSVGTTRQLMVGSVGDSRFGSVRATLFSKVVFNRDTLRFPVEATAPVYDSIVLVMAVTGRYGDTTVAQNLRVHRLTERLDRTRAYYSSEQLQTGELLGQATYRANLRNGSLVIRLNQELGRDLFQRALNSRTSPLIGQDRFEELLNGIRLSATGPGNAAIMNLDIVNTRISLIYRRTATDTVSREFRFPLLDPAQDPFTQAISFASGQSFVQFQGDLSRSRFLANLPRQRAVGTNNAGNEIYLQAGAGISTRLEFPGILNLRRPNTKIVINRAVLSLNLTAPNFDAAERNNQQLPNGLFLVYSDRDGRTVRDANGNDRYLIQEYSRGSGGLFPRGEVYYNASARNYPDIDITTYLQTVIDGKTPNNGIIFKTTQFGGSVSKLLFGDQRAAIPADRLQLKVNYTVANL